jgi:ribosomal protein L37AE/L43A
MSKDEILKLEKTNTEKPIKPCWNCGMSEWWKSSYGVWLCGICHPKMEGK